jgi:hypothetical protein
VQCTAELLQVKRKEEKKGRKMAICACGMRGEHCAHLMHVFPRVILFVEDCQQGSSSRPA